MSLSGCCASCLHGGVLHRYAVCVRVTCTSTQLLVEVVAIVCWTAFVAVIEKCFPGTWQLTAVSETASYLNEFILGTLLVFLITFRSKQAYDRWEEGRTAWGKWIRVSFDLCSNAGVHFTDERLKVRIIRAVVAFASVVALQGRLDAALQRRLDAGLQRQQLLRRHGLLLPLVVETPVDHAPTGQRREAKRSSAGEVVARRPHRRAAVALVGPRGARKRATAAAVLEDTPALAFQRSVAAAHLAGRDVDAARRSLVELFDDARRSPLRGINQ